MKILGEADIDERPLRDRRIAVIGYGNQGRAQALNLSDAGRDVRVGVRAGGPSVARARADGLEVGEPYAVAEWANVILALIPDEHQPALLARLAPAIDPGDAVGFAHGFNVTFERVTIPSAVGVFLVAPCAPGARLRESFLAGTGVFAYVATRTGDERCLPLALAYARAIGCARAGVLVTTFRDETEVDLFGEQVVLCGGLHALLTAACDTLVEAGYAPEMAYLECVHQLVWLAATIQQEGIAGTRRQISTTALYGDLSRGRRVIGESSRRAMHSVLDEIRQGDFAAEFIEQSRNGFPALHAELEQHDKHPMEEVGRKLRDRLSVREIS